MEHTSIMDDVEVTPCKPAAMHAEKVVNSCTHSPVDANGQRQFACKECIKDELGEARASAINKVIYILELEHDDFYMEGLYDCAAVLDKVLRQVRAIRPPLAPRKEE